MGELKGTQWQPRDLARLAYEAGWTDALRLTECVQIALSESQGYDRAYNDNVVPAGETRRGLDGKTYTAGQVWQRDCGVWQIGIPASQIGTEKEEELYTPGVNVQRARALYELRQWQPWAAHSSLVYLRDTYVKRAVKGVGNFLAETQIAQPADDKANPRYLTNPVLDYYYHVTDAGKALREIRDDLTELKLHVNEENNKRIQAIVVKVANAQTGLKK